MTYKQYPNHTKAYIVVHQTGFGVQEAPYVEHDAVFETDDYEEAKAKVGELIRQNNSPEQIASSWIPNTYTINVNTSSELGRKLEEEFSERFKRLWDESKSNPNTRETQISGITCRFTNFPPFDDKHEYPTRIVWSTPKKPE